MITLSGDRHAGRVGISILTRDIEAAYREMWRRFCA